MKQFIFGFLLLVAFYACKKNDSNPLPEEVYINQSFHFYDSTFSIVIPIGNQEFSFNNAIDYTLQLTRWVEANKIVVASDTFAIDASGQNQYYSNQTKRYLNFSQDSLFIGQVRDSLGFSLRYKLSAYKL